MTFKTLRDIKNMLDQLDDEQLSAHCVGYQEGLDKHFSFNEVDVIDGVVVVQLIEIFEDVPF